MLIYTHVRVPEDIHKPRPFACPTLARPISQPPHDEPLRRTACPPIEHLPPPPQVWTGAHHSACIVDRQFRARLHDRLVHDADSQQMVTASYSSFAFRSLVRRLHESPSPPTPPMLMPPLAAPLVPHTHTYTHRLCQTR
ncbi:unnamed protein product [Protopolystoma xenopodis]|uniref:Uncharacterized protein n=1 Tax=Protopolystoma xenopodis TaxID=117903 RepID=A0A3S4ZY63_9PLAT|nr:unnamed protein product [Protopolystoma xenopodis]